VNLGKHVVPLAGALGRIVTRENVRTPILDMRVVHILPRLRIPLKGKKAKKKEHGAGEGGGGELTGKCYEQRERHDRQ
jgi:hypothetical protein